MTITFHLSLISPERALFEGEASMVTAPGAMGEFGVLPGHAPLLTTLKPGIITVERTGKPAMKIGVLDGFVEVNPESCTILTSTARDVGALTRAEAEEDLKSAREDVVLANESGKETAEKRVALAEAVLAAI